MIPFVLWEGTTGDPEVCSPARVIAKLLVDKTVGVSPPNTPWPVYTANEPDLPDNVITVYNTIGQNDGRFQLTGERFEHYGIMVRIRGQTDPIAYAKAWRIAIWMDEGVYQESVTVDNCIYCVHSLTRTSRVLSLGNETPLSKRRLFTVNAILTMKQVT